jgi:hypothetical protein
VNVTLDPSLLSTLGIPCNLSEMGEAGLFASLAVDFVQRFNFSATDDGVVTFMSPHVRSSGYAAVQVFDKDGATTVDSQALFYNLKVTSPRQDAACCFVFDTPLSRIGTVNGLRRGPESSGWRQALLCSVNNPDSTEAARPARHALRYAALPCAVRSCGRRGAR